MTPMTAALGVTPPEIVYLFSDGKLLAQSIKQGRWITLLYRNICSLFHQRDGCVHRFGHRYPTKARG